MAMTGATTGRSAIAGDSHELMAGQAGTVARFMLFAAIFLYFWVGYEGFKDPTDPSLIQAKESGNLLNQATTIGLVAASAIFAYLRAGRQVASVLTPLLGAMVAWIGVSIVFSVQPMLAGKRFVLATFILFISAVFLLLPRDERQFTAWLGGLLLGVIVLCFASVMLVPTLAIHQAWDLHEPGLAGAWRGAFPHKNAAGSAMLLAALVGVYIALAHRIGLGLAIVAGALTFLVFTESKTPLLIMPATLVLTWLVLKAGSAVLRMTLISLFIVGANVWTLGSVVWEPVRSMVEAVMPDPTFTNRTQIWEFALSQLSERPLTGFGFHSYWNTEALMTSGSGIETWATRATEAHNAYLDLVLNLGVPGLVLACAWIIGRIALDLTEAERRGTAHPHLSWLYVVILMFSLLSGALESHIFAGGGCVWFMTLVALFGLRFQATEDLVPGEARDGPGGERN
jgi:O-antigen ligase